MWVLDQSVPKRSAILSVHRPVPSAFPTHCTVLEYSTAGEVTRSDRKWCHVTTGDRNPRRKSLTGDVCVVCLAYRQPAFNRTSSPCLGTEQAYTYVRLVQWTCCSWDPVWCRVGRCAEVRGCVGCSTNTWYRAACEHTHTPSSTDASWCMAWRDLSDRSLLSVWQTAVRILAAASPSLP
jgi:hypothetical protein